MKIYIPTLNRPGRQRTAEALRESNVDYCLVLCDIDENKYDHPYIVTDVYGIRATRQWIMDQAEDKFVMMDDDLRFHARRSDTKFEEATPNDVGLMVNTLDMMLDQYAHGGVTEKFMSHTKPRNYVENARYYHILGYNKAMFPEPRPTYRVEIGEDHDMCLQLLTTGRSNFVLTEWANDDKSHAEGGCNSWRNPELEVQEAKKLCELFPGLITHVDGPNIRISWKKAAAKGGLDNE